MYHFLPHKLQATLRRLQAGSYVNKQRSNTPLYPDLDANIDKIFQALGKSKDIILRRFSIGPGRLKAALVFIDGLVDRRTINESILSPLQRSFQAYSPEEAEHSLSWLLESVLTTSEVHATRTLEEVLEELFLGKTVLFFADSATAFVINTQGFATRAIEEPDTEAVVRGPREGFTENLRTNTALLRRKIRNPDLRLEHRSVGVVTHTKICLAYIKGITDPELVEEVRQRLGRIQIDGILESGYIEGFIEDAPYSIFATVGNTEKPDVLAGKLLEGRVGIFVDGTPMVLTVPHLFVESLQSSEDYYSRPFIATMNRWLRILAMFTTTMLPAFYVSLKTFHPEMIPTILLITMAAAKEGVPFPVMIETLFMATLFEIMREAGVRLPRPIGQSISIVGALVLGEAAIRAGMVSAPTIIVTGITAIAGFLLSSMADAFPLIRIFLVLLAAVFGLYGVLLGVLIILIHLAGIRSFGVPYLTPLAPLIPQELKDVPVKVPIWGLVSRPELLSRRNLVREQPVIPRPPNGGDDSGA